MFLDPDGPEASQLLGFPITQVNNHPSLFNLVWVWFLQLAETVSTNLPLFPASASAHAIVFSPISTHWTLKPFKSQLKCHHHPLRGAFPDPVLCQLTSPTSTGPWHFICTFLCPSGWHSAAGSRKLTYSSLGIYFSHVTRSLKEGSCQLFERSHNIQTTARQWPLS